MKHSIIIPMFDETDNIQALYKVLHPIVEALPGESEVVFVDDGSRDDGVAKLREIAKTDRTIRIVRLARNFGKSAAMTAGFHASSGEIIINLDADLQDDPNEIPRMLAKLDEGYDFVVGWRTGRSHNDPKDKTLPSKLFNAVVSRWSGVRLHDFNCGFKAYRRSVLEDIPLYSDMHRFIPVLAAKRGFRVTELPVTHHKRHAGVSKYGVGRTLRGLLDFVAVLFLTTYMARPMHFFGTFGVLAIFFSGVSGIWALELKLVEDVHFVNTPLPLLTVFLFVLGVQFILLGLLAEMMTRTYFESAEKETYRIAEKINF